MNIQQDIEFIKLNNNNLLSKAYDKCLELHNIETSLSQKQLFEVLYNYFLVYRRKT